MKARHSHLILFLSWNTAFLLPGFPGQRSRSGCDRLSVKIKQSQHDIQEGFNAYG
jgi:hypothetical protein